MKKVFAELGIGNDTFFSTEFEEVDSEYRIPKFILPNTITGYYFRLWVFKKVIVLSLDKGVEVRDKDRNKFKILLGVSGVNE